MINSGEGGLTIGEIQMDQYYPVNEGSSYDTREQAESFIRLVQNTVYGAGIGKPVVRCNADFQITETNGKFYIWYKLLEKHTL